MSEGLHFQYKIGKINYQHGYGLPSHLRNVLRVRLDGFQLPEGTAVSVLNGRRGYHPSMLLYLNRENFQRLTGRDWDGTMEGVAKVKDLEGTVYTLDLGLPALVE